MEAVKPFKKFQELFVARRVPGAPYVIGDRVMVVTVTNVATKRNPEWRYYVAGAWMDHDALSETNPVES